jgi:hypothetical protein
LRAEARQTSLAARTAERDTCTVDRGRVPVAGWVAPLLAALLAGCGGSSSHTQALREATQACRYYVSVNGLTGPESLNQYRRGVAAAESAAAHDGQWREFAGDFRTFVTFNDALVNGKVNLADSSATAPSVASGKAIALECARLGVRG